MEAASTASVVVAIDNVEQLSLVDRGAELARHERCSLEILSGCAKPSPTLCFVPINVGRLRREIGEDARAALMAAIDRVPPDIELKARLVRGRAWDEVRRLSKLAPGEILAVHARRGKARVFEWPSTELQITRM